MLLSDGGPAGCDVFFGHFQPNPVIADAEPQIAAAF
jgi:hypothetical protein